MSSITSVKVHKRIIISFTHTYVIHARMGLGSPLSIYVLKTNTALTKHQLKTSGYSVQIW